jgi:Putative peptidoglycan binding domain
MKKRKLFIVFALVLVYGAFLPTYAQSTAKEGARQCPKLNSTLQRGARDTSTGGQVTELQKFLSEYYNISSGDIVSGYFGRLTQKYVQQFQGEQNLPNYGIAGSLTRGAIAKHCSSSALTATVSTNTTANTIPMGTSVRETPTLTLTTAQTIIISGSTALLTWTTTNAQRCVLSDGTKQDVVTVSGSKTISPTVSTTYTLWCTNEDGSGKDGPSASKSLAIVVLDSPPLVITGVTATSTSTNIVFKFKSVPSPVSIQVITSAGVVWEEKLISDGSGTRTITLPFVLPTGVLRVKAVGADGTVYAKSDTYYFTQTANSSPTLITMSPRSSATAGTQVTLTGTNLSGASEVNFYHSDGTLAFTILPNTLGASFSDTSISFNLYGSVWGMAGPDTYSVRIVTPNGVTNNLSFILLPQQ